VSRFGAPRAFSGVGTGTSRCGVTGFLTAPSTSAGGGPPRCGGGTAAARGGAGRVSGKIGWTRGGGMTTRSTRTPTKLFTGTKHHQATSSG
jgi:hypothetical protein